MRARSSLLFAALALFAACVAPEGRRTPPRSGSGRPREEASARHQDREERARALRAARVWSEPPQPTPAADLSANPPGGFRTDEDVSCTFHLRSWEGWSPKFACVLPDGEEVKVKYGHNSVEVFAEVAATRLLSALGFGADRMYVVHSVQCRGCPLHPYPRARILDALRRDEDRVVSFDLAAIERKLPGRSVKADGIEGWTWPELDQIDPAAGGSSGDEVDALRLMAVFLNHWDGKARNQRLVCRDAPAMEGGCAHALAYLQDVGETFGPRGVDLAGWRGTPVWSDPASCRVSMKALPYEGAGFGERQITEGGRRFLGDRLRQLTHAQIASLFAGARFPRYVRQSAQGRDVEAWAAAFEDRVRQISDRPPCPR